MRKRFLFLILLSSASYLYCQDIIVKTNGEILNCQVIKTDSLYIFYNLHKDKFDIPSSIEKSQVKDIKFGPSVQNVKREKEKTKTNQKMRNCLTIGILEGGGSLVGFDYEILLSDNFGIQVGAGIVGFGAGINIHLKPNIRSSFFTFQYWHQGIGDSHAQTIVGPAYVYRSKKWFTAQIGLGFPIERGPAYPFLKNQPPVILTYAIGGYIPL